MTNISIKLYLRGINSLCKCTYVCGSTSPMGSWWQQRNGVPGLLHALPRCLAPCCLPGADLLSTPAVPRSLTLLTEPMRGRVVHCEGVEERGILSCQE